MATIPARMSFYLRDEDGQIASMPFYVSVDTAKTSQDMLNEGQALGTTINNMTGCQIIDANFGLTVASPGGWRPSPAIGSSAHRGATVQFTTVGGGPKWGTVVPSILDARMSGNRLNRADSDVSDFIGRLLATTSGFRYTDERGVPLDAYASSFLTIRKPPPGKRRLSTPA